MQDQETKVERPVWEFWDASNVNCTVSNPNRVGRRNKSMHASLTAFCLYYSEFSIHHDAFLSQRTIDTRASLLCLNFIFLFTLTPLRFWANWARLPIHLALYPVAASEYYAKEQRDCAS